MPARGRWFSENQPFTPAIQALRGLLMGGPVGHDLILAAAWWTVIAVVGFLLARAAYNRSPRAATT